MLEGYAEEKIAYYVKNRNFYEDLAIQVFNTLKAAVMQQHPDLKIASYSKRTKEIDSLRTKLLKDKYSENSEITDLAGVRVIVYSRKDISAISEIIKKSFKVDLKHSVDKTETLGSDRVGYRGEHYVVTLHDDVLSLAENKKLIDLKCEIQVTSLIAHTWSEITHEKGYKFEGSLPVELERRKNLLAGMLELADMEMDSYVESFDRYVKELEMEMEKGCLKYTINSMTLEKFMAWKFPCITPQVFRDIDLTLTELHAFGLNTIKDLNELITPDFIHAVRKMTWRSLDGIIRNILIINDAEKYFKDVWNPDMNQMNRKNYELYRQFHLDIDRICKNYGIRIV